jgi:hypothetical protein
MLDGGVEIFFGCDWNIVQRLGSSWINRMPGLNCRYKLTVDDITRVSLLTKLALSPVNRWIGSVP